METFITAIFKSISSKSMTPEIALLGLIIFMLVWAYKKLKPLVMDKLNNIESVIITKPEMEEIVKVSGRVEDTIVRINKALEKLDKVEENSKDSTRYGEEIKRDITRNTDELRRDLEQVKYVLSQFQGHMMYGRRSSDFENQELK